MHDEKSNEESFIVILKLKNLENRENVEKQLLQIIH